MSSVRHYLTSSNKLSTIPESVGNIIFCEDIRTIYLDDSTGRKAYSQIHQLATEVERGKLVSPINGGYYFVIESSTLYNYDSIRGWSVVAAPHEDQIIFDDISDFPPASSAKTDKLYISGSEVYRFYDGAYHLLNADSAWETL